MNKYFHAYKGKAIFQLMSMAGYEIFAPGNHEFDKGPKIFADALDVADFQCICSDLNVRGSPVEGACQPWLIRSYDGLKVGFLSLMTEDFPFVTSGDTVRLAGKNIETARHIVKEIRKNGAQIIVALTHVGYDRDHEIAEAVPDIDVIFGGHSHEYLSEISRVGKTIIVNGGERGEFLVRLDIPTDSSGRADADKARFELIPVKDIVPDAEIDAVLAKYVKSFPKAIVLGHTEVEWNMTKDALRKGESVVANLVNDLMRKKFGADIVLNNAGAFRGKKVYPPGPVTDAMLKEIDEFGNYAYLLDMKGKHIKEILERSAACYGEGGLLHASGLRYAINLERTAQKIRENNSGELIVTAKGDRVSNIEVRGADGKWVKPDPNKTYRVLSNGYIVNKQGDGYFWFRRFAKNLKNTYSTFYSILAELAESKGVLLNPGKPDGRLTVIK